MKIPCSVALVLAAGSPQGGAGFTTSTAALRNVGGAARTAGNMRMAGWQPREDTKTWGRDSGGGRTGRVSDPRAPPGAQVSDPRAPPGAYVSDPRAPPGARTSDPRPPPGATVSDPRAPLGATVSDPRAPPGARVSDPRAPPAGGGGVSAPGAVSAPQAAAPAYAPPPPPQVSVGGGGPASSGEAGAGFAAAFAKVEQALDLSPLDHAEAMGLDAWEVGGNTGTIAGFQGKKVDWVSRCTFQEADGSTRECLRAWVMPMFDVPHLSISIGSGPNGLTAEMDLVSKDDLMFAKAYREQYYGGRTSAWWEALVQNAQAAPAKVSMDLKERALASPVHFSITMPDTAENAAVLGQAAQELADIWLGFLDDATEIARVRRGTMLSRDSELRRLWWAVVGMDSALGARGPEIAAGMAGPGDQGYTGQAS